MNNLELMMKKQSEADRLLKEALNYGVINVYNQVDLTGIKDDKVENKDPKE
jgi:hypothetical protein